MGNFEDRMRNIGDELSWEKLKEEYNAIHPGREEHGYGLGAADKNGAAIEATSESEEAEEERTAQAGGADAL